MMGKNDVHQLLALAKLNVLFLLVAILAVPAAAFESSPIGWASVADSSGTPYDVTGGSAGATVTATDESTFKSYATSSTPYVILVPTTITMTRGSQVVSIQSNKTIVGIGSNPGINGGFNISGKTNVIVRNLNIWYEDASQGCDNPSTDGITVQNGSQHIWIDHCNIFDSPDGLIDPTKQSDYITISWCKFYYTPTGDNTCHRNCNLVGSSDSDTADRGKLKETFHHNWWSTNCKERMPRVRFGQVHVFNNYYSNLMSGGYCHGVGEECQIRVENNYYNAVPDPWKNYSTSVQGIIGWNTGNVFHSCSVPTWAPNDYNNVFTPPYSYSLDSASDIPTIVQNGAGVDKLTPSPNPMTFAVAPHALSSSSIAMTASTASCDDGVEYYFACTAGGGHDSGWQTGTSYTDTGLSPNTSYTYTVRARNQTQTIFTGAESSPASAMTPGENDTTPPAAPTGLAASAGDSTVGLDWNDNNEVDLAGYNVYRSTTSGTGYVKQNASLLGPSGYTDNSVTNGITYYYVVTAVDTSANESDNSTEASAAPQDLTAPAAPAGLSASAGDSTVGLDWSNNSESDLAGYNVYRSTTSGTGYAKTNGSLLTSSDYTDNSVTNDTTYYYVVTAVDANDNESVHSGEVSATPLDTTAPAVPTHLTAIADDRLVRLEWNANGETDLAGYNIYRSATSGSGYVKLNGAALTDPDYNDTDVTNVTTYYYVVTAIDTSLNESAYSSEVPATPTVYGDFVINGFVDTNDLAYLLGLWLQSDCGQTALVDLDADCTVDFYEFAAFANNWLISAFDTNAPAAPANLSATPGDSTVSLDWDDNGEADLAGYNVYRSLTSGSGYGLLNGSPLTDSNYIDNSVTNGTTYYYVVTAVDSSLNESDDSGEVSAAPQDMTPPAAPTGLSATPGDGTVSLDWNDNGEGDLAGYGIYRSTTSGSGYSLLNGSPLASSNYTDNSVTNGTTYYYVVVAVDFNDNQSLYSGEASATPNPPTTSVTIQENQTGFCSVDGTIDNNHSGFTGDGFANTDNAAGNGIDYSVNVSTAGTYTFIWRYANSGNDRPANLIINGTTAVSGISFPNTNDWANWSTTAAVQVTLTSGIKSVRLEATGSSGLANIDYMQVTGPNLDAAVCP
jgi:pectate lyase